jgi:hypothetical protein
MEVMNQKVQLVQDGNFYYVFSPITLGQNPRLQTCFPYSNGNQNKELEKAREFARQRVKDTGLELVEELQNK